MIDGNPNWISPPNDNYSGASKAATGISGLSTIGLSLGALGSVLGVTASLADQKNRNEAVTRNIEAQYDALAFNQNQTLERARELSDAVGMALTEEGLATMKLESTAAAMGAESGSTTMAADLQSGVLAESTFRVSEIRRKGDDAQSEILRQMQSDVFNTNQRVEALTYGQPSPLQAGLDVFTSGLNMGTSGFMTGQMVNSLLYNDLQKIGGTA